jgi:hypothetical protein
MTGPGGPAGLADAADPKNHFGKKLFFLKTSHTFFLYGEIRN